MKGFSIYINVVDHVTFLLGYIISSTLYNIPSIGSGIGGPLSINLKETPTWARWLRPTHPQGETN